MRRPTNFVKNSCSICTLQVCCADFMTAIKQPITLGLAVTLTICDKTTARGASI